MRQGAAGRQRAPRQPGTGDVRTGKLAWVFHTIPAENEAGIETWPSKDARKTHGGGHNWSECTVDEQNGIAFVSFGSPQARINQRQLDVMKRRSA